MYYYYYHNNYSYHYHYCYFSLISVLILRYSNIILTNGHARDCYIMMIMGLWLDDRIMVPLEKQLAGKTLQYKPHLGQTINSIVELVNEFSDANSTNTEEFEGMKQLR